ncbi:MAG: hypothetical protein DRR08_18000 [Candidatus Parabeggiatoa sp. nov. 2]|nr:MAG: hypothetical protein B6247_16655 [Beggiatoa sp. 4572_84]RKZ57838.1 MAG: hypothetical protein DRR08_18000 [Gammaproteobacteria bacterium]HEC85954.1 hypothetical protein [Thioploca sp.]
MPSLTIVVEDKILQAANLRALEQNTTVTAILCDYLAHYSANLLGGVGFATPPAKFHCHSDKTETLVPGSRGGKKADVGKKVFNNTLPQGVPGVELLKFAGFIANR